MGAPRGPGVDGPGTLILTAALLLCTVAAITPTASARSCGISVSVDNVQACGNYAIDTAQFVGGWAIDNACDLTMGDENCD